VTGPWARTRVTRFRSEPANEVRRGELRRLVAEAFDDDFSDEDWAHTLGGWHVVAEDSTGRPLGHAAVVGRTLYFETETMEVGYVEAVATAPEVRGLGIGTSIMEQVDHLIAAYRLGALSTAPLLRKVWVGSAGRGDRGAPRGQHRRPDPPTRTTGS
jgi:aminoglycoside 2'-N-acetyltransferase I